MSSILSHFSQPKCYSMEVIVLTPEEVVYLLFVDGNLNSECFTVQKLFKEIGFW